MAAARRQTPTVRLRGFAAEMRGLREAAGLSQERVVELTRIDRSTLNRIEGAKVRPQQRTLLALLDAYGVTDQQTRDVLVDLLRKSAELSWLQQFDEDIPDEYATYIAFEAEAGEVRNYESLFVPGLLQTEDYARASVSGVLPHASVSEVERRVEARMQRQAVISKGEPLKLWVIVDEAALRREVGGPQIMEEQLARLVEVCGEPHVTMQVLPYRVGAHPGMHGAFAIMSFANPAAPSLVYVESMAGALFLERDPDVRRYSAVFEDLRAAALPPRDSVSFIQQLTRGGDHGV